MLNATAPKLANLLDTYSSAIPRLSKYATGQNFRAPFENLATVVHELVHIDSKVHEGYFIDGTYYEPYLKADEWPRLTNSEVLPTVLPTEQSLMTRVYARDTPSNNLGNVLDELNAYGHVAKFVCVNEPTSGKKQVANISGLLALQEAYLRFLRQNRQDEYNRLIGNRLSAGAIETITVRAMHSLQDCGFAAEAIFLPEFEQFRARRLK